MTTRNNSTNTETSTILRACLEHHTVSAHVVDLDYYRTGVAMETDYIVCVQDDAAFETFYMSKTYSSFRALIRQLKDAVDKHAVTNNTSNTNTSQFAKNCHLIAHLMESQKLQYLGKVSYLHVKTLAKQRQGILETVLNFLLEYFPTAQQQQQISSSTTKDHDAALYKETSALVETFFLTDHCIVDKNSSNTSSLATQVQETLTKTTKTLVLNPIKGIAHGLFGVVGSVAGAADTNKKGYLFGVVKSKEGVKENSTCSDSIKTDSDLHSSVTILPMTRKTRHAQSEIELESSYIDTSEVELPEVQQPLVVEPTTESSAVLTFLTKTNAMVIAGIGSLAVYMNLRASTVKIDADIAVLCFFAAYCVGLHTPFATLSSSSSSPAVPTNATNVPDKDGRLLLRRSVIATTMVAGPLSPGGRIATDNHAVMEEVAVQSPLPKFPDGAPIGSHNNCWSQPDCTNFHVRGPSYFENSKKVASGEFLFKSRGIDLFLTDMCPENVGALTCVCGGDMRKLPTFVVNFRLPWGILIFYAEIPEKLVPFVKAAYEKDFDKSSLLPLTEMSPGERTCARFLMASDQKKNELLKIVPVVVDGPWVVKSIVGGKPAIIGTKLPVTYHYAPEEGDNKLYLELDLNISASSAARGILSVTRSYTQVLTLDIGFVIQSNEQDELPEQMLLGTRIHGVDPLTAPTLPPQLDSFFADEHEGPMKTNM
jgi:hypothetical protein